MAETLLAEILEDVIKQASTNTEEEPGDESQSSSHHSSRRKSRSSSESKVPTALVEIDCSGPEITVSQVDREAEAGTVEREDRRQRQRLRVVEAGDTRGGRGRGLELSVAVLVSVVRGRSGRWKVGGGGVIWGPGQKLLVR